MRALRGRETAVTIAAPNRDQPKWFTEVPVRRQVAYGAHQMADRIDLDPRPQPPGHVSAGANALEANVSGT